MPSKAMSNSLSKWKMVRVVQETAITRRIISHNVLSG